MHRAVQGDIYLDTINVNLRCILCVEVVSTCSEIMFHCDNFNVPNNDKAECSDGTAVYTKPDSNPVRA